MHVIIDGRPLQTYSAFRGIGRYVNHVARAFGRDERAGFLFFRGRDSFPGIANKVFTAMPRRMITWTDSVFLPALFSGQGASCYHSTAYALPRRLRNVRYLMTVFDLTPLKFPQFFPLRQRLVFKSIIRSALRADTVLAISARTAADLLEFVPVDAKRIRILPCMLDEQFTPGIAEKPAVALPGEYLLYTGGADRVKNLETLLQAISRLQIPLVVAGMITATRSAQLLAALPARDRRLVAFAGYVPDSQLAYLYHHAAALVFPSLNEGFGYPPLEALQCGTAAVVSRAGSLPEILADAAVFVDDPLDPGEWAARIGNLLADAASRDSLIASGKKLLGKYSPTAFKKNLEDAYFRTGGSGQ
jgi:glycosyltransferase involved in cell wall biosynthesis